MADDRVRLLYNMEWRRHVSVKRQRD